jgi:succinate dehydrogenase / fumarate reductase flavoprotein subunit/L-aspartate oxidase
MPKGIPWDEALKLYQTHKKLSKPPAVKGSGEKLIEQFHPDYYKDSLVKLQVGPNKGETCHRQLAALLQANPMIDEADLAGAPIIETDILIVGAGGAGCAAALLASEMGARVILATKLRLGDSNTVMAEGGIQASIKKDDTPQKHFDDTMKRGHKRGNPKLIAQMVMDAPDVVRWLIEKGMQFDMEAGDLRTRRAAGTTADRVVYCHDYTGLEMMRVMCETVRNSDVEVWEYTPVIELLSNDVGHCAGGVVLSLGNQTYSMISAQAVILGTGGIGCLHLNDFPTSNHFGATGDGLVLAYRLGAKLLELGSYQYHPTGMGYPKAISGSLVTEGVRSAGAQILNGLGERFVNEMKPRDFLTAAILKECVEERGVISDEDTMGVWLDTPLLEKENPGIMQSRFPKLLLRCNKYGLDPLKEPLLIYPTLHYQNGGIKIDENGATTVPGLYCAGEVSGGIHGKNRLMGNALLEIISFGRLAGAMAVEKVHGRGHKKITIEHLRQIRRELTNAGMSLEEKSPLLFPTYSNFGKKS